MTETPATDNLIYFNGVNGATGQPWIRPLSVEELVRRVIDRQPASPLDQLERSVETTKKEGHLAAVAGVNLDEPISAGWAVLFPKECDANIISALQPLLQHRKAAINGLYREFLAEEAVKPGEDGFTFLARSGADQGPVDPKRLPFYVLIVGSPEQIPFSFERALGVQYAVGRLHLESAAAYANYAAAVIRHETAASRSPDVALFGPANPGDVATQGTLEYLIKPLKSIFSPTACAEAETATKPALATLLQPPDRARILITASHGLEFPAGDNRQRDLQGALVCQQWRSGNITEDDYFAASDLQASANLGGLIAIMVACFSAGTPQYDDVLSALTGQATGQSATPLATSPFLSKLPTKLLGHDKPALAVVGHVNAALLTSFLWLGAGARVDYFEQFVRKLRAGIPLGRCLSLFRDPAAQLREEYDEMQRTRGWGGTIDQNKLVTRWLAREDLVNYVVLGDPAVRFLC